MTKKEWAACAALLATFYPHSFKMESTTQVQLWFDELKDLPGERVHAAIKHMVRTQPAFPSLADIRKHAEPQPIKWSEAWAEVMKAVGEVGMYGQPEWSDPVIGRAVDALGGWQSICQTPRSEHGTMRAQFRRAVEEANEDAGRDRTYQQLGVEPPKRIQAPLPLKELLDPGRDIKGLLGPGPDPKEDSA